MEYLSPKMVDRDDLLKEFRKFQGGGIVTPTLEIRADVPKFVGNRPLKNPGWPSNIILIRNPEDSPLYSEDNSKWIWESEISCYLVGEKVIEVMPGQVIDTHGNVVDLRKLEEKYFAKRKIYLTGVDYNYPISLERVSGLHKDSIPFRRLN